MLALLAGQSTTTTIVRRVVGDPLPSWVVVAAGAALLALIMAGAILARRPSSKVD